MQKHERACIRALERLAADLEVTTAPGKKHRFAVLTAGPVEVRVPMACSPADEDTAVLETVRLARRMLRDRGVAL